MKRMSRPKKMGLLIAAALAVAGTTGAQAGIGVKAGDWDLDFSGNVNGFATWNDCDNKTFNIAGGLACNSGPNGNGVQSVQSGLLPSALAFQFGGQNFIHQSQDRLGFSVAEIARARWRRLHRQAENQERQ